MGGFAPLAAEYINFILLWQSGFEQQNNVRDENKLKEGGIGGCTSSIVKMPSKRGTASFTPQLPPPLLGIPQLPRQRNVIQRFARTWATVVPRPLNFRKKHAAMLLRKK